MSNQIPEDLIEKIKNNEVIPFVGAGISTGVKDKNGQPLFLNWKDLLLDATQRLKNINKEKEANFISSFIDVAENSEDYCDIADKIKKYLSSDWKNYLKDNFDKSFEDVDKNSLQIANEIWNINKLIITTNYDKVMSWASDDKDLVTWNIKSTEGQLESLKKNIKNNTIWHLHGKISELDDIVLTTESYEKLYGENSDNEVTTFTLKNHLTTKSFIFLGFSLDDEYLKEQLKTVNALFKNHSGPHYILVKEKYQKDLLDLGDIRPIFIDDYEDDYLKVLKQLTQNECINDKIENVKKNIDSISENKIKPFNVPFQSKEEGAIGIEEKLDELHEALLSGNKTKIGQVASFEGMGGLGKTQLAVEYAYKYKDSYDGVVWLTIDQNIEEQLIELGEKTKWIEKNIDINVKIKIVNEKYFLLKNALLIFDNVDNYKEIEPYFPESINNKILITSRNNIQGFNPIELLNLDKRNSLKLLESESHRKIQDSERDSANILVKNLDGLPLALEMAGAYVGHFNYDWNEYYDLFSKKGILFLEKSNIRSYTNHETNIAKTLMLNDVLLNENPLLKEIVHLLAWSASDPMDKKLISILLEVDEIDLIEPLKIATKLKFIKQNDEGFTLHRLVKEIWKQKEELSQNFSEKISYKLSNYMKEIKNEFLELKNLDKASIHAKVWSSQVNNKYLKASLINYSVYAENQRGKSKKALDVITNLLTSFEEDDESSIYAELLNNKGYLSNIIYNPELSDKDLLKSLNIKKKIYGENHLEVALTINNIGTYYQQLAYTSEDNKKSLYLKAISYYKKSFQILKKAIPNKFNKHISDTLCIHAEALDQLGRKADALVLYKESLDIREYIYRDTNHPDLAYIYHKQSFNLEKKSGNIMAQKALKMYRKLYPNEEHPTLATFLNDYGLYSNNYNYLEDSYKMYERLYGKDHAFTIACFENYIRNFSLNPLNKKKSILLVKEYKKGIKNNYTIKKINSLINNSKDQIGRSKSKRKKNK